MIPAKLRSMNEHPIGNKQFHAIKKRAKKKKKTRFGERLGNIKAAQTIFFIRTEESFIFHGLDSHYHSRINSIVSILDSPQAISPSPLCDSIRF